MKNDRELFRDRLIKSDRINPDLKKRYEKEMKVMFEQKISPLRKAGMLVIIAILLTQIVFFSYAAFTYNSLPVLARIGFICGIVFAGGFIVIMISALRRGTIDLRKHPNMITGVTWIFLVILVTLILLLSGRVEPLKGIQMVVNATIFWIMGAVFLLKNTIEQSELKTREKLLEIEYKLAELSEK